MGLDKFIKDTIAARNLRASDPAFQAKLDAEAQKVRESWREAGNQTLGTVNNLIWNRTQQSYSTAGADRLIELTGRILAASGRTTWYGIRKLISK